MLYGRKTRRAPATRLYLLFVPEAQAAVEDRVMSGMVS